MDIQKLVQKLERFEFITFTNRDAEVRDYLKKKLRRYELKIKKLCDDIIDNIVNTNDVLIDIYDLYYQGCIYQAYSRMETLIKKNFNNLSIYTLNSSDIPYSKDRLFRGRIGNYNDIFKLENLFHVPYNNREIIKTYRYSIPGQPCLYLGQSLFTVWQELRRPRLEDLYISMFRADKSLRILDLAITLKDLVGESLVHYTSVLKKYLYTNVFRIASSVKVKGQDERSFKSEYIIPQLLLLAITNSKFDGQKEINGIRHLSVFGNELNSYIHVNYAFPAKYDCPGKDYSNFLINNFELTEPVNLGIIRMYNSDFCMRRHTSGLDYLKISLNDDFLAGYKDTEFYELEEKIAHCPELQFKRLSTSH